MLHGTKHLINIQIQLCNKFTCSFIFKIIFAFTQHTSREFYNNDGKVVLEDSGVWITPLDYLGIKAFADVSVFRNASFAPQDGVYGGFPYYLPLRHLVRCAVLTCHKLKVTSGIWIQLI